jgi:hypothetical protein
VARRGALGGDVPRPRGEPHHGVGERPPVPGPLHLPLHPGGKARGRDVADAGGHRCPVPRAQNLCDRRRGQGEGGNARAPTSPRSIGFCVIWESISSSSSSRRRRTATRATARAAVASPTPSACRAAPSAHPLFARETAEHKHQAPPGVRTSGLESDKVLYVAGACGFERCCSVPVRCPNGARSVRPVRTSGPYVRSVRPVVSERSPVRTGHSVSPPLERKRGVGTGQYGSDIKIYSRLASAACRGDRHRSP